jgi:very-short-patch-repair endonuclease
LIVAVGIASGDAPDERLLGLAQTADWLARETRARVAVLLPDAAASRPALDAILYDAIRVPAGGLGASVWRSTPERATAPACGSARISEPAERRGQDIQRRVEARFHVLPVLGHPHPFSPGEQALAAAIRADAELAPLFGFNLYVRTVKDSRFLVDLLWSAGQVVVEVDSYRFHASPELFASDRQRDYELLVSGYRVLRVTHDEALDDTAAVVEKIREVVRIPSFMGSRGDTATENLRR